MFCYYCGLVVTMLNAFQLSGAQGFHVQMTTTIQCVACGPDSPPECRSRDCSIPVGQEVQVNCTVAMECDPLSHPLRMLRVSSGGIEEIVAGDISGVMPGFTSLETTGCFVRLTFTATLAANNLVLQCGVSTNEVMEYSKARVLAVREPPANASPAPAATSTHPLPPSPSPALAPSTTSSTTEITSPPITSSSSSSTSSAGTLGPGSSVGAADCVCNIPTALPTSLPNGARTFSLSTLLTLLLTFLSIMSVVPMCL